jgi:hypothetical protein
VNVADLQKHLNDLTLFVETSGGKKGAAELRAVADGLQPFRELSLKELVGILARAAEPPGREAPARKAAAPRKKPRADPGPVAKRLRELYDRATDPTVTREHIDAELKGLEPLSKDGLKTVARALDLVVPGSWSADEIAKQIGLKIHTRRDVAGRARMHGMPEPSSKE